MSVAGPTEDPRPELHPLRPEDLDEVLRLNQRWVPHVGRLDRARLERIVGQCALALSAWGPGAATLDGFVLVLGPGADYDSPNYRWFAQRHDAFRYVDRVAVAPERRRSGTGARLYAAVVEDARRAGAPVVAAEVNVDPPNPDSLAFHRRAGFREVGRRGGEDGSPRVALLELAVGA